MTRYGGLLFAVSCIVLFFNAIQTHAASSLVVSEIGAYPTSTHEWVEVHNIGSISVDMSGWKFWEGGVKHALTAFRHGTTIAPGSYAVIAQDAAQFAIDHPEVAVPIFDSVWTSLSENGEEIGLYDSANAVAEIFTYPAHQKTSLERKNFASADYTLANWGVHPSGSSVGFANSGGSTAPPPDDPPGTADWSKLRLNEILVAPTDGTELVELFNTGSSAMDLTGGTLCDDRATSCLIATLEGTIAPGGFAVVTITGSKLNNGGDKVILKDPAGTVIDELTYADELVPSSNDVLVRSVDGGGSWVLSTTRTFGSSNIVTSPVNEEEAAPPPSSSGSSGFSGGITSQTSLKKPGYIFFTTSTSPLYLSEVLVTDSGFVELYNHTDERVSLSGWRLAMNNTVYALDGVIERRAFRTFYNRTTKLFGPTSVSGTLWLFRDDDSVADMLILDPLPEGTESLQRLVDTTWARGAATPNKPAPTTLSSGVIWNVLAPRHVPVHRAVTFDASRTFDKRGGRLVLTWIIDDAVIGTGSRLTFTPIVAGTYRGVVSAATSRGSVGSFPFVFTAADGIPAEQGLVMVTEVAAESEGVLPSFIKIINNDSIAIDLDGWQLALGRSRFTIPEKTILAPRETAVFFAPATGLEVPKSATTVELYNRFGERVSTVSVPRLNNGFSYTTNGTAWMTMPTQPPFSESSGDFVITKVALEQPSATKKTSSSTSTSKTKTTKPATTKKTTTKTAAKSKTVVSARLADIRLLPSGTPVDVQGVITSVPGIFGKQIAYLSDESGGLALFQSKSQFPALKLGDEVRVRGTISIAQSRPRILIKTAADITRVGTRSLAATDSFAIEDLSLDHFGMLISVRAELTERKRTSWYLDDGTAELLATIKTGTGLTSTTLAEGSELIVTGVLENGTKGVELWPRGVADVEVIEKTDSSSSVISSLNQSTRSKSSSYPKTIIFSVAAVAAVGIGAVLRKKLF